MLNLDVYKYPMFALSSVISMIVKYGTCFQGCYFFLFMFKTFEGFRQWMQALLLMPGALLMAFMSPLTGKLFDQFGGRILAIIGLAIMVVTTYFFSKLTLDTTYTHLMIIIFCAML